MRKLFAVLAACALAAATAGCGTEYDRTEITYKKPTVLGGSVDRTLVTVPEGMVVTAHITPYDDDDELMALHVRSKNDRILEAVPVISNNDWAFIGNQVGETDVEVLADDRVVLVITARVTAQPEPSSGGSRFGSTPEK